MNLAHCDWEQHLCRRRCFKGVVIRYNDGSYLFGNAILSMPMLKNLLEVPYGLTLILRSTLDYIRSPKTSLCTLSLDCLHHLI